MTPRPPASGPGPDTVLAQRPAPIVEWVEVDHQVIVWNADTTELHRLDPIATLVFRLCDGTTSLAGTVADLAALFHREPEQIWADVTRCVEVLRRGGLVEIVGPGPVAP